METTKQNPMRIQTVYDEYQPRILRYISNLIGEADAEDVTQEVFIKVSKALSEFRGESKISTWLYRIATNAALDYMRSSTHQQKATILPDDSAEGEVEDRNIWTGEKVPVLEWQVVREEMSSCVHEYIQKLPENYRTVLVLGEFEGLSNQEIADILEITLGTAKIRLHRARERLKNELIANCPSYWVEGNEFLPDLKNL